MNKMLLLLTLPYWVYGQSVGELFEALKSHSQTKSDEMVIKQSEIASAQATSQLYPTVNLFGTADNYSTPTGMVPVPPNTLVGLVQNPTHPAQPFSYNIYRAGAEFTMPIFVKSIYTMVDKAKAMHQSAKEKKEINLLKNEALIVGSNANLQYLRQLQASLEAKEQSLLETEKVINIKVQSGRSPASALYKIKDNLNQVKIAQNNIALQKEKLLSSIETLTGIRLQEALPMQEVGSLEREELGSLKPLETKLTAQAFEVKAQKEKLYPSVVAHGNYSFSRAKAYNNGVNDNEHYGNIGIAIKIPLLAMSQDEAIMHSKVELMSEQVKLEKLEDELSAKATSLNNSLPLLDNSIELAQQSIENKEHLLEIAKVNYTTGRLPTEEYLRYEDDVVDAKAKLYQAKAQKWQTLMELAVIYANNIEEMVK